MSKRMKFNTDYETHSRSKDQEEDQDPLEFCGKVCGQADEWNKDSYSVPYPRATADKNGTCLCFH